MDANTRIVLTPVVDMYAAKICDYSRVQVPPTGEGETPEIGSVEFSRGWTHDELSELVREGRNLALNAQSSVELMYDRDPAMMCDLSGRLFNVPPVTLGERVRRRIVRKLPLWRPAHVNPPALSHDLAAHVDTSLGRSAPHVHEHPVCEWIERCLCLTVVWVSMETGRIDQLKFGSVVVLPDDALVGGARGLMPLPGGGYVAAQWIRSSCIDPNLRAAVAKKTREELDLEILREKFTGVIGAGNRGGTTPGAREGVDGEGTSAAKGGGRQKRRARGLAAATQ